jgi:hypothetical protein
MINLHDIEYRSERIAQIGKEGKDCTFEIIFLSMNVGSITFVINTLLVLLRFSQPVRNNRCQRLRLMYGWRII